MRVPRVIRTRGTAALVACASLTAAVAMPFPASPGRATPSVAPAATRSDGTVYSYGAAGFRGSPGSVPPAPLVAITGKRDGSGYWIARVDGGVYHYGSALWYGAPNTISGGVRSPVVAITAHPSGHGYWVVTRAGTVYAYGSSAYRGHPGPVDDVVAIAATPTGNGYWLAAADGGVFSFGDATFYGSAFGHPYHGGITGIAATPSGKGYWLVAADGTVFGFGDADVPGSAWGAAHHPIVGIAPTVTGAGYWLVDTAGGLYRYGDAATTPAPQLPDPHVSAAGRTTPRPPSVDAATVVHSPSVAVDRHVTGIASAAGLHSIWLLADQYAGSVVLSSNGATGNVVRALQSLLLARGFWLRPTGVFDNETQQAVWAFQKYWGLSRSGYVTMLDYRALISSPHVVARSTSGTLVEVDKPRQVVFLVHNGGAVWAFNSSTGSEKPYTEGGQVSIAHTPEGLFHIIRQVDGLDIGPLGALWRPKYFTNTGVALHGNTSVPPYPASHGCARVSNAAIDYLWATNSLPIGLPVWVY